MRLCRSRGPVMSAYLRNYVESVAELPSELSRCFKLMRELDNSAHELQQQAEEASRRRLAEFAAQVQHSLLSLKPFAPKLCVLWGCNAGCCSSVTCFISFEARDP